MRLAFLLCLVVGASASAQQLPPGADSALARAARMAESRDSTGARRVLDSLATAGETVLVRGEAAFQLAQIASSAAERERMLGAFILDHAFSPRLPSALLALGELQLARNERDMAALHLARYLTASLPGDSSRIGASLALGRLLVERGELPRGCAVLLVGRSELPAEAIEVRNQFEFSVARCQGIDTSSKIDTRPIRDTTPARGRTGAFTVQIAAYETRAAAERLATTLRAQGLEARVVGTAKPYRVRVGRYATRSEAEEASRRIDAVAKSSSIVVVVGPEER